MNVRESVCKAPPVPSCPKLPKKVFKDLGSRRILGESWVGRFPLPVAFSAENQNDRFFWWIMVVIMATCKISMSSFCFLRVSSSSLILLSFSSSTTPPQSRLFMLSLLSQVVVTGQSQQDGYYHLERLPPLIFLSLDGEPAREEGRESVSLPWDLLTSSILWLLDWGFFNTCFNMIKCLKTMKCFGCSLVKTQPPSPFLRSIHSTWKFGRIVFKIWAAFLNPSLLTHLKF